MALNWGINVYGCHKRRVVNLRIDLIGIYSLKIYFWLLACYLVTLYRLWWLLLRRDILSIRLRSQLRTYLFLGDVITKLFRYLDGVYFYQGRLWFNLLSFRSLRDFFNRRDFFNLRDF